MNRLKSLYERKDKGKNFYVVLTIAIILSVFLTVFPATTTTGSAIVPVTGINVAPVSLTLGMNTSHRLTASILPLNATNRKVNWVTSSSTIATIDSEGTVTAMSVGTATITATSDEGAFVATSTVRVVIPVTGITLSPTSHNVDIRSTFDLVATVFPQNATNQNVTWTSNHPNIVSVASNGRVTALAPGSAVITVTTADGGFTAISTITTRIVPITSVSISAPITTVSVNRTLQLTAVISPSNATNQNVVWTSDNQNVATISSNGLVTARGAGSVTITATTQDGGHTATIALTATVVPVTGISLSPMQATMNAGTTHLFSANISPPHASFSNIAWTSSNTSVATVDPTGQVRALGGGTTTIMATVDGGLSAFATVNVVVPVTGVSVTPTSQRVGEGVTHQLIAIITPANATNRNLVWTSSDNTVATVNSTGLVRGVRVGTATITATTQYGGHTATSIITVQINVPVTAISLTPANATINAGATQQLNATLTPANATERRVIWTSSDTAIATVSDTGLVTGVGGGVSTITATTVDGGRTATSRVTVNVVPVTGITLAPSNATINAGATQQLTATVAPPTATNRRVTWSSSNPAVAAVNDTGLVAALSAGTATITATTADGGRTASSAITVTVVAATGLTVTPTNAIINAGTMQQLTATVVPANASDRRVTWISGNHNIASVDAKGLVTAIRAGTVTITAITVDGTRTATSAITVVGGTQQTDQNVVIQPVLRDRTTVITIDNIVEISVPQTAVAGHAPIISSRIIPDQEASALFQEAEREGLLRLSGMLDLSLTGGEFVVPVYVAMNFDPGRIPAGKVPALFVYNERTDRWVYIGGNRNNRAIAASVREFSRFAVFAADPLPILNDISGHWGSNPIITLAGMNIVEGFPDGTFRPDVNITRAEFAAILSRALNLVPNPQAAARFADAAQFMWAQGVIGAVVNTGLLRGYADNTFKASQGISRAEVAAVIERMMGRGMVRTLHNRVEPTFTDDIPGWAQSAVQSVTRAGFMKGFQDNTFRADKTATRAEISSILYRLFAER